jgi:adenosylhomocysteinase
MNNYHIRELNLADRGLKRILWADKEMPVLAAIRQKFLKEKPLKNLNISCCLHVTTETANLVRTLKDGGANVLLCASNPLSTQDDVAASLVKDFDISVYAIKGENNEEYYSHILKAMEHKPDVVMDDGADLISTIMKEGRNITNEILGSTEETTTGVIRLKSLEKNNKLKFPVIAVNDAHTKYLFDNRYGTGESSVYSFMHNTNLLVGGKTFVVAGFGFVGRGIAEKLRGLGANVIVTEVDPIKALEAHAEGFTVMNMDKACERGEVFITATGDIHVIRKEHFLKMRDGAILGNAGHFNVEVDVDALEKMAEESYEARPNITGYKLPNGKVLFLLAEGRLMNLAAGQGHPAEIMDLSFAAQFLSLKYLLEQKGKLNAEVLMVPTIIDEDIAFTKLSSLGINIDTLTEEQKEYLSRW